MKSKVIKPIISIVVVSMLAMVFFIVQNHLKDAGETEGKFRYEIDFPRSAGVINENLVIKDNLEKNHIENSEILDTYYIVREEISDERKEDIIKAFDMEMVKGKEDTSEGITVEKYERGNRQLTIYSNGTYRYKKDVNNDKEQMKNVDFKEKVLVKQAEKFLKENNLIPGDFAYSKMGETEIENIATGEKKVVTKDLYFAREIDGIEVEGTSKIIVSMDGNCEVDEVYSSYREIEKTVKVKENYSVDEMVNRLKGLNGKIYINENADEVTLDDVEVIYYEDSAPYGNNITIQPIYRVKGANKKEGKKIDEFVGLTSAIKR